jgi:uncharacterized protein (DUF2237 family)
MRPALAPLERAAALAACLKLRFSDAPAGTGHYMLESMVRLCEEADALLLGACGLPSVCYPDNRSHRRMEKGMLRDDSARMPRRESPPRNVLGETLEICSISPMTGFFRDGCCNTSQEDVGSHTVCVVTTAAFLEFSKSRGNDLSTPMPEFGFPGLKPGDRWCLCAPRWQEALEAGKAPRVVLRATHEGALSYCSLADLKRFALDLA